MSEFLAQPITPAQVMTAARQYLGKPYLPFGRGAAGLDCVDLALLVGIELGQLPLDIYSTLPAYSQNSLPRFLEVFYHYVDQIDPEEVRPGCGYLFCHDPARNTRPKHVSIATDLGVIGVSLLRSVDKVCEHEVSEWYAQRAIGGWKYKGLVTG